MRSGVCAFHRFFHHSTTSRSLQHWFLQHSNFSRKVCNILLCNNWKIAGNSCNICLQQKCCKKQKFTTFFKCCKKKANVAKKKTYAPPPRDYVIFRKSKIPSMTSGKNSKTVNVKIFVVKIKRKSKKKLEPNETPKKFSRLRQFFFLFTITSTQKYYVIIGWTIPPPRNTS